MPAKMKKGQKPPTHKWGDITERQALDKLIKIIDKISEREPSKYVKPKEMDILLREFVKEQNPKMDDKDVNCVAPNIRGWLGSRYTMLSPKNNCDYVNVEDLQKFIDDFERSEKPYGYRRKVTTSQTSQINRRDNST